MNKIICSGALFYTLDTQRFLFLHRTQSRQADVWGLVGGTNESEEIPYQALMREIKEEIGECPPIVKSIPLETFVSNDHHFLFHTYLCFVDKEFIPKLNDEHNGYAWVTLGYWPRPLHIGLHNTLKSKINQVKIQTVIECISILEKDSK